MRTLVFIETPEPLPPGELRITIDTGGSMPMGGTILPCELGLQEPEKPNRGMIGEKIESTSPNQGRCIHGTSILQFCPACGDDYLS